MTSTSPSQTHPCIQNMPGPTRMPGTGKAETSPLDSPPECWTYVSTFCFSPQKNLGAGVLPVMPHTELGVGVGMGLQISAMILSNFSFDVGTELLTSS